MTYRESKTGLSIDVDCCCRFREVDFNVFVARRGLKMQMQSEVEPDKDMMRQK